MVATDYIRMYADHIRAFVPARYAVLGTDGFGRLDTRWNSRRHFEVDRAAIAYTALVSLVAEGKLPAKTAKEASKKYKMNIDAQSPLGV